MKIEELSLSALKYFIDAIDLESITLSADKNHVSRAAVSQAILRLEQWCGKPLLEHGKRTVALTKYGREFYLASRGSLESFEHQLINGKTSSKSIKIGCSTSLLEMVYPKIEKFMNRADSPVVKFGTTDQLMDFLKSGAINIALAVDNKKHGSFKSYEFHRGVFQLLSKSGHFEDTLITTDDRPETDSFRKFAVKRKLRFKSHIQVEIWSFAARFAQLSSGCCLVPDFVPAPGLTVVRTPTWKASYSAAAFIRKAHELSDLETEMLISEFKMR